MRTCCPWRCGRTRAVEVLEDGDDKNTSKASAEWQKLMHLLMQLRKCCSHPYLFKGAEPAGTTEEDLVLLLPAADSCWRC